MMRKDNSRAFKKAVIRGTRFIQKHNPLVKKASSDILNSSEIIVAVDIMGGDYAPLEIIKGSIRAAREFGIKVQLVGPPDRISRELSKYNIDGLSIEIVEANEFISMEDKDPVKAIRSKNNNTSVVVATNQVATGQAHAVVSAGSTGAAAAAAFFWLGRISGIERPGIAALIPTSKGQMVLIDAGANAESTPLRMAQHAIMGSLFASKIFKLASPRVGLLNIGEEPGKGNQLTKEAFSLLNQIESINFVGNVEGRTLAEHYCDVLVSDGFVGNVFLKTLEGTIKMSFQMLYQELTQSIDLKIGAAICKPAFRKLKGDRLSPAKYGGAVLLGVNGVVVIAHGNSNDFAIMNAIKLAADTARSGIINEIKENLKKADLPSLSTVALNKIKEFSPFNKSPLAENEESN